MKTANVREIRQNFPRIMAWIADGEQVAITMRRKIVARLTPEKPVKAARRTLATSATARRDKSRWPVMHGAETVKIVRDAGGKW
jgi:antitoxin (DNA-binding transcriptional repressor) of toxin-antitoxin stability system